MAKRRRKASRRRSADNARRVRRVSKRRVRRYDDNPRRVFRTRRPRRLSAIRRGGIRHFGFNPLWRRPIGSRMGLGGEFVGHPVVKARRLHRIRKGKGWHNNPVRYKSRRRSSRRIALNPVAGVLRGFEDILSVDTVKTIAGGGAGLVGSLAIPQAVLGSNNKGVVGVLGSGITTALLTGIAPMVPVVGKVMSKRDVFVGGILGTALKAVAALLAPTQAQVASIVGAVPGLSGAEDEVADELKKSIQQAVAKRMSGLLTPSEARNLVPSYSRIFPGVSGSSYVSPSDIRSLGGEDPMMDHEASLV